MDKLDIINQIDQTNIAFEKQLNSFEITRAQFAQAFHFKTLNITERKTIEPGYSQTDSVIMHSKDGRQIAVNIVEAFVSVDESAESPEISLTLEVYYLG